MSLETPFNMQTARTAFADYDKQIAYENAIANDYCQGQDGCDGPVTSNLNMGDGTGMMITTTCNNRCRDCMLQHMPGAWIESTDDPPDLSPTSSAKDNELNQ